MPESVVYTVLSVCIVFYLLCYLVELVLNANLYRVSNPCEKKEMKEKGAWSDATTMYMC